MPNVPQNTVNTSSPTPDEEMKPKALHLNLLKLCLTFILFFDSIFNDNIYCKSLL